MGFPSAVARGGAAATSLAIRSRPKVRSSLKRRDSAESRNGIEACDVVGDSGVLRGAHAMSLPDPRAGVGGRRCDVPYKVYLVLGLGCVGVCHKGDISVRAGSVGCCATALMVVDGGDVGWWDGGMVGAPATFCSQDRSPKGSVKSEQSRTRRGWLNPAGRWRYIV